MAIDHKGGHKPRGEESQDIGIANGLGLMADPLLAMRRPFRDPTLIVDGHADRTDHAGRGSSSKHSSSRSVRTRTFREGC
jgi:hypothetical protein